MFSKVFIANRGEIAVRIITTCRRLNIATAIGCSTPDMSSLAAELADEAFELGPAPARESYLDMDAVMEAVAASGADAVHPGFGFLSENPAFARRCAEAGVVFIGPNPEAIDAMGDKIASKKLAKEAGVSVIPGFIGAIADADEAARIAADIGYPVMIKASAGGGGKGMRPARDERQAREGFQAARNEARGAFGDDRILIEKLIEEPRHIEIQVLGDRRGNIVHLGERECSIQRRRQKVVEEAPSAFLDARTRKAMGEQAVALARAANYDSAGTVEFIVDAKKNFYFLEMNTRLQVEHPVTELVTGLDLVEQMIRVAAGETLGFDQKKVRADGWAIEARLYAEDPARGFLPAIGRLSRYREPPAGGAGVTVRVDSGVREGDAITIHYDPMIAKLIAHAADREAARQALLTVLDRFELDGLTTNRAFLAAVLDHPLFRDGAATTAFVEEVFPDGFDQGDPDRDNAALFAAAAVYAQWFDARRRNPDTPGARRTEWAAILNGGTVAVGLRPTEGGALITVDDGPATPLVTDWRPGERVMAGRYGSAAIALDIRPDGGGYRLARRAARARVVAASPRAAELRARLPEKPAARADDAVRSPMPGLVSAVHVAAGHAVKDGERLVVIEAMKMENVIRAERDGVVKEVIAREGETVAAGDVLIELE